MQTPECGEEGEVVDEDPDEDVVDADGAGHLEDGGVEREEGIRGLPVLDVPVPADRKSTRLNSSHANISYAVFCLKKKKKTHIPIPSSDEPIPNSFYLPKPNMPHTRLESML